MNFRGLGLGARLGALALVLTLACQVLWGDYTVGSVPLRECVLGETRCLGSARQLCTVSGWTTQETCSSPALCNLILENCSECVPGTYQCNDGEPQLCGPTHEWISQRPCGARWSCRIPDAPGATPGYSCSEKVCDTPLAFDCEGRVLRRCSRDQDRWDTIEVCATEALCDAKAAQEQADRGEPVHCASPAPCGPTNPACPKPGCVRPNGTVAAPGEFQCAPTNPGVPTEPYRLERCKADLSAWDVVDVCPFEGACDAERGLCRPTLCEPQKSRRCAAQTLQICTDPSGATWQDLATCTAGQCDPSSPCKPCDENAVRCNDRFRETCLNGTWQRTEACATPARCAPTACLASACAEGEFRCEGLTLKKCNAGRDGFYTLAECARSCDANLRRCLD